MHDQQACALKNTSHIKQMRDLYRINAKKLIPHAFVKCHFLRGHFLRIPFEEKYETNMHL